MAKRTKFNARLKADMQARGRTLGWLAEQVGISQSHLSDIMSGRRRPSLPVALRLEQETGIPARAFADVA